MQSTACVCFNSSSTLISGCSPLHWFKSIILNNCPVDATNWAIWAKDEVFKSFMVGRVMFAICPSWPSSNVIVKRAREFCGKREKWKKWRKKKMSSNNVERKWVDVFRSFRLHRWRHLNRYQFERMENPMKMPFDIFLSRTCCAMMSSTFTLWLWRRDNGWWVDVWDGGFSTIFSMWFCVGDFFSFRRRRYMWNS